MPYHWVKRSDGAPEQSGASSLEEPIAELHLWPYRSLPREGFVIFIASTCIMLSLPLAGVLGTAILWGLLPFMVAAVAGIWWALARSYRDGALTESLQLWPDRIELIRRAPDRAAQSWRANPYWVEVHVHAQGGPVPHYLTLKGGDREVELGAFLTEQERLALADELRALIAAQR
ncbi:MAG: DUF2244 domain-containing protein [Paracoccaceae bacterium]